MEERGREGRQSAGGGQREKDHPIYSRSGLGGGGVEADKRSSKMGRGTVLPHPPLAPGTGPAREAGAWRLAPLVVRSHDGASLRVGVWAAKVDRKTHTGAAPVAGRVATSWQVLGLEPRRFSLALKVRHHPSSSSHAASEMPPLLRLPGLCSPNPKPQACCGDHNSCH
ncbi:hypothetical protein L209DRAFT_50885 [Thermothelomyces heterothallicus CBS 203.75]